MDGAKGSCAQFIVWRLAVWIQCTAAQNPPVQELLGDADSHGSALRDGTEAQYDALVRLRLNKYASKVSLHPLAPPAAPGMMKATVAELESPLVASKMTMARVTGPFLPSTWYVRRAAALAHLSR